MRNHRKFWSVLIATLLLVAGGGAALVLAAGSSGSAQGDGAPQTFSIFDTAQTVTLGAEELGGNPMRIAPDSARLAQTLGDRQVIAARVPTGDLGPLNCIVVKGKAVRGIASSCNRSSEPVAWLQTYAAFDGTPEVTLYLLASDDFDAVSVDGRSVPIRNNVAVVRDLQPVSLDVKVTGPSAEHHLHLTSPTAPGNLR